MKDHINIAHRFTQLGAIPNITQDEFRSIRNVGIDPGGMHLRIKTVKDANVVSSSEQCVSRIRTDKPGAARDKNLFRLHLTVSPYSKPSNPIANAFENRVLSRQQP